MTAEAVQMGVKDEEGQELPFDAIVKDAVQDDAHVWWPCAAELT